MSRNFRTQATHDAYEAAKRAGHLRQGCRLCEAETLHAFTHWREIPNTFPYDAVAAKHTMLIPKRHVQENELTDAEKAELLTIKRNAYLSQYNYLLESIQATMSIPAHYHVHLIKAKDQV